MPGDDVLAYDWYASQGTIDVGLRLDHPFTLSGDIDGPSYEMAGTGVAASYYVGPPPIDEDWHLTRLLLVAIDSVWTDATDYGAINNGLPTGINIYVVGAEDEVFYQFNRVPIKRSYDWALLAGLDAVTAGGAGSDPFMVRWTFRKAGHDVLLKGSRGMRLKLTKPDDLSSLSSHIIMVQGFRVSK